MLQKKQISILGCGWLGLPLGKHFSEKGYVVKGSTTTENKLQTLQSFNIDPFLVQLAAEGQLIPESFLETDILIITIPPRHPDYLEHIEVTINLAEKHRIQKVIYISSTSVYGDNNEEVSEFSKVQPETESAKKLKSAEDRLLACTAFASVILRFAGLIGPGRHPARFLAGKSNIPNGRAPVNLIHLDDCIGLISAIVESGLSGTIINGCAPQHPMRQDFYTQAALATGLPAPHFTDELLDWKIVNSLRATELGYAYQVADLVAWLSSPAGGQL